MQRITTIPKVVVAKVNGFCFTGASRLALACDLMVVAEEAKLGDTHAKFGLRPTWGMSQRLVQAVGITRARDLSYTARTSRGSKPPAWGMAVKAVPRSNLDAEVAALCAAITQNFAGLLAACKDLYRAAGPWVVRRAVVRGGDRVPDPGHRGSSPEFR
ncbi:MAG: enoyl-CoA hydratase/isomerase family protein [Ilumatobacteraceae bacterium]